MDAREDHCARFTLARYVVHYIYVFAERQICCLRAPRTTAGDTEDDEHRTRAHHLRENRKERIRGGAAYAVRDDEHKIRQGVRHGALYDQCGDAGVCVRMLGAERVLHSFADR